MKTILTLGLLAVLTVGCGDIHQLAADAQLLGAPTPYPSPTAIPMATPKATVAPAAVPTQMPSVNVSVVEYGKSTPVTVIVGGSTSSLEQNEGLIACPKNAIGAIWQYVVLQRNDAESDWRVVSPQGFQVNAVGFKNALINQGVPSRDLHITQQLDNGCVIDN